MSLIALLSLSSSASSSSRSPSSPGRSSKLVDLYQRIPFHSKARRNSQTGGSALKTQGDLHLKLYGTNKKSRYRSLLTGFSVDVVERFDRLLAPYSISSSNTNNISHPGLLVTSDGLYAPQSSLSLFMDSLHFLPQAAMASSWRNRKPVMLATSAVYDNSNSSSSANKPPPMDRQIELVAFPRRRSVSRAVKHQDQDASLKVPTVVIPSRATRRSSISNSRSPTSRHSKQGDLRRAIRANAQLSSALMNKKMILNEASTTGPTSSEISYEINEEELASRFYIELRSNDSRETTSNASGASTPRTETKVVRFAKEEDEYEQHDQNDTTNQKREGEWKAKQLDLERQVAALVAENQAKTALIKYLMDENSRIVGDCECGNTVKATVSASPESEEIHHHHSNNNNSSSSASSGRAQQQGGGEQLADHATGAPISKNEPESPLSSPTKPAAQVSSIEVQVAKRKLPETEPHVAQNQNQQQIHTPNQKTAASHEVLFEGLVSEIEAEFSQLFTCESSA